MAIQPLSSPALIRALYVDRSTDRNRAAANAANAEPRRHTSRPGRVVLPLAEAVAALVGKATDGLRTFVPSLTARVRSASIRPSSA